MKSYRQKLISAVDADKVLAAEAEFVTAHTNEYWDDPNIEARHLRSKGRLRNDQRVAYAIDDQPKNRVGETRYGIQAVLHGELSRSWCTDSGEGLVCRSGWREVTEYFGV